MRIKRGMLIAAALLCIVLGAGGFLAGRSAAENEQPVSLALYGEIEELTAEKIIFRGAGTQPDMRLRGTFSFDREDGIPVTWYGREISMKDLRVGDDIAVYWMPTGYLSSPRRIEDVRAVHLLR